MAALRLGLLSTRIGRALALLLAALTLYVVVLALIDENLLRLGAIAISCLIVLFIEPLAAKYPAASATRRALYWTIDGVLLVGFLITVYWFWITADELWDGVFDFETSHIVTGYFGLLVILELTRRTFGVPLMLVTVLFVLYAVLGRDLPSILQHAGIDPVEIIRTIWYSQDGVFGRSASIVANLVLIFIVFGAILGATGAGAILLKMSFAATGAIRGGPAHAAIMASALFGTMSGSAMANVVGTGVFTIPIIRKRGFSPPFAGAVEAAASCSGQVTPPIMAAAAFFVADFTGTPYLTLIVAALLPALFKYISIFAQVYAEAIRLNIEPVPKAERERLTGDDWLQSLRFFIPILALIAVLVEGRSPARSQWAWRSPFRSRSTFWPARVAWRSSAEICATISGRSPNPAINAPGSWWLSAPSASSSAWSTKPASASALPSFSRPARAACSSPSSSPCWARWCSAWACQPCRPI